MPHLAKKSTHFNKYYANVKKGVSLNLIMIYQVSYQNRWQIVLYAQYLQCSECGVCTNVLTEE